MYNSHLKAYSFTQTQTKKINLQQTCTKTYSKRYFFQDAESPDEITLKQEWKGKYVGKFK